MIAVKVCDESRLPTSYVRFKGPRLLALSSSEDPKSVSLDVVFNIHELFFRIELGLQELSADIGRVMDFPVVP